MQDKHKNIVGIILAGGRGRRLGGLDKGLQLYRDAPLITHVIDRLSPQVDEIVICANRNIGDYQTLGFSVIEDIEDTFQGPMAGIYAAFTQLQQSEFDSAAIASCDAPGLPNTLIKTLSSKSNEASLVAVAHDGERKQNLHCLIKRAAWGSLIKSYQSGERAMHRWFAEISVDEIDFSDQAESFFNINSAELLET